MENSHVDNAEWTPGAGNFAYFSRIESASAIPVSAISFDPYEELLWTGNIHGRVNSYYGATFDRYTAFVAASGSDVRQLDVTETGIISLCASHLKFNTRHGVSVFTHGSSNCTNLLSMYRSSGGATAFLGGDQKKMIIFDIESQKEIRVASIAEKNATIVKGNSSSIFTADTEGTITMRSQSSLDSIKSIKNAHGGPISDFDVCGNLLITCGCSFRLNSLHGDPYVKVYDLRSFNPQAPLALAFAPVFTRFLPTFYDSRVILVSQVGQAQIADLNERGPGIPMIIESEGYSLTSFSSSSTKQILAFGDEIGNIHIYADRPNPVANESSFETYFADPPLGPPHSFNIDDPQTSLATVPLPFSSDDALLSDWSEEFCQPMFRKQKPLGPYPSLKNIQFVGYASNPRAHTPFRHFNIVPYYLDYEVVKDQVSSDVVDDSSQPMIPQFYRKLMVPRPSRIIGLESAVSPLLKYNKSKYIPLENTSASVLVNPIVNVMFNIEPLRQALLSHLCDEEYCLVCQLQFLFRMVCEKKFPDCASSTNLIRAMLAGSTPLLNGDIFSNLPPILNYLIEGLHKYYSLSMIGTFQDMLRSELNLNSRCIRCGEISSSTEEKLVLKLCYPTAAEHLSMCTLIEKALHARGQSEGECKACNSKTRIEETRKVKCIPPVILVDADASSERFLSFWQNQLRMTERRPRYQRPEKEFSFNGSKTERKCRYASDCRNRPYCKYHHGVSDWDSECDSWLDESTGGECWHCFLSPSFYAKVSNGIAILSESTSDSSSEVYDLVGFVSAVATGEGRWENTVSVVLENEDKKRPWCILNELLVTRVTSNEALHLDPRWKLPLFLAYVSRSYSRTFASTKIPIPSSIFQTDSNLTGNHEIARERKSLNLPNKGEIVGIDAEFISVCQDHNRKSVGRVSCVDSSGTRVIVDDYIVTCEGDVVDDYLTPYSGIMEDDLDPSKSTKHLTTLKNVYLKILHLVEKGVIFVGHGLNNDFSVLNIYVPPEQLRDTVQLFHIPHQRMLSLQFLAWNLLNEKIQEGFHDSIEDARIALRLYHKYIELQDDGSLESTIKNLYEIGKSCNWRSTDTPVKSVSPCPD